MYDVKLVKDFKIIDPKKVCRDFRKNNLLEGTINIYSRRGRDVLK